MLINRKGEITLSKHTKTLTWDKFSVYWEGFVYGFNKTSGEETIKALILKIKSGNFLSALSDLRGAYVVAINNPESEEFFVSADAGGQLALYKTDEMVSTSLIDLARTTNQVRKTLSNEKMVEFILTGFQFGCDTLFSNIKRIPTQNIVKIKNDQFSLINRRIEDDPFNSERTKNPIPGFLNEWKLFAKALTKIPFSVDLTGGTDSRLIVSILDHLNCFFETAISGQPSHPDVIISNDISRLLPHKHFITMHKINEDTIVHDLLDFARRSVGITDLVEGHRLFSLEKERLKRGVSLSIHGGGGELYKDAGQWRYAFKAFGSKRRFINGVVDSGFACWGMDRNTPQGLFTTEIEKIAQNYKSNVKNKLMSLSENNPDQGLFRFADNVFYNFTLASPRVLMHSKMAHYSPLLDPVFASYGINLPHTKRFGHGFHRQILSELKINEKLTSIPTTRLGMTLQPGKAIRDAIFAILTKTRKKEDVLLNDKNMFVYLRKNEVNLEAFKYLTNLGILNPNRKIESITDKYLGRIISLWIFHVLFEET